MKDLGAFELGAELDTVIESFKEVFSRVYGALVAT